MEGTYRNLARVSSGCPCPDGIPAKSTAQMPSKVSQPPLQIAMALARLLYLPRLVKVAPTALLILLDANRSWRDLLRHDCLPCGFKPPVSAKFFHVPMARCLCLGVILRPNPLAVGSTWSKLGLDPRSRGMRGKTMLHNPLDCLCTRMCSTLALLRVWLVLCLASCPDGPLHGGTCYCQFRITVHF